ncbi:MAG TPA: glutamine amidotransferase [Pseudonocardiaceae bacterium]
MKPFLLVATRAHDAVAEAEYQAFLRFGRLSQAELVRVRLESAPLDELVPGLDLNDYSGVILGGSPFTSSDPPAEKSPAQVRVEGELERLIGDVLKLDVPFLGACYGIATLGSHLGGVIDRTFAEPVGAVPVSLTADGLADPLLAGLPETFLAFVGHKEALQALPPGAVLLAGSAACPVQMFQVGEHQYATQFHPELDVPGIIVRIHAYRHNGYFHPDEVDLLIEQVSAVEVRWPARILANFTARYAAY